MLEITPDHIAELADDDLRTLIGLLCEAELARHNLPVSAVTWGGNQRAADGGLDVRVALPAGSAVTVFVPRPNTGFQVKCQDMPRNAILAEMRPANVVRPVICELADASGAYVIVSSQGSTADSALQNRRASMLDPAVLPGSGSIRASSPGYASKSTCRCVGGTAMALGPMNQKARRRNFLSTKRCACGRGKRTMAISDFPATR